MATKRGKVSLSRRTTPSSRLTLVSILCKQKDGYDEVESELVDRLVRTSREGTNEPSKGSAVVRVNLEGAGTASILQLAVQSEYVAFLTESGRVGRVRFASSNQAVDKKRVAGESTSRLQEVGDEVFARRLQEQLNRETPFGSSSASRNWPLLMHSSRLIDRGDEDEFAWMAVDDHDYSSTGSFSDEYDTPSPYYESHEPLLIPGGSPTTDEAVSGLLSLTAAPNADPSTSPSGRSASVSFGRVAGDASKGKSGEREDDWPAAGEVEWLEVRSHSQVIFFLLP